MNGFKDELRKKWKEKFENPEYEKFKRDAPDMPVHKPPVWFRIKRRALRITRGIVSHGKIIPGRLGAIFTLISKIMPVLDDKPSYKSKTIWGVVIFALTGLLQLIGVPVDDPELLKGILTALYTLAGSVIAYGLRDTAGKLLKAINEYDFQGKK